LEELTVPDTNAGSKKGRIILNLDLSRILISTKAIPRRANLSRDVNIIWEYAQNGRIFSVADSQYVFA
jgi:hypothetical protein